MHVLNNNIKYTSTILRRKSVKKPHLWQWILNNKHIFLLMHGFMLMFFFVQQHQYKYYFTRARGKYIRHKRVADDRLTFFPDDNYNGKVSLSMNIASFQNCFNLRLRWPFLEYIDLLKMKSSLFLDLVIAENR